MELNFREYYGNQGGYGYNYNPYDDPHSKYMPPHTSWSGTPSQSTAAGAYLGYALSGMNPLGAVAGGLAGYGLGKYLGPKARPHADPRAYHYARDEFGRVQRHLPTAPEVEDLQDLSDEDIDQYNANPTHPYGYYRDRDDKVHWYRKGSRQHGMGMSNFFNRPQQRR